ncbi:MAG: UbiD family decarboxylase [Candidatus Poseidoniaceae archaeon]|jgi:UbiD family decarboxylase|nr:UbiD family decarboxylase [Candidatus Poseidoniaceae archaeon]
MAFRNLLGEAQLISEPISVLHGIFDTSIRLNHELLMFDDITEAPGHRVVVNLLTRPRLCSALGIAPEEFIDLLGWAMDNPSNPLITETGPVLENIQETVNLDTLPIPHHWREDRGRYMSASIIIAEYNGIRNTSFHRQFVRDRNHVVARIVPRHLRTMMEEARSHGSEVNIAVVNAPDPTVLLAAAMSFNDNIDELNVAASLHQKIHNEPLKLTELPNGIHVPADSEYAMWGRITTENDSEGPYVDITGTVDDVRQEPVIEIDGITHRNDPIFHALIPGESEHKTLMGLPRAPTIKSAVNEVCECLDVHMTEGGCGWLAAVVKIRVNSEGDGMRAITAALDGHKSMKMVTVVDEDIDITNPVRVEWAMMTRWQPDIDSLILSGQKGSSLDPSRHEDGNTSKIGIDATIPWNADKSSYTSVQ